MNDSSEGADWISTGSLCQTLTCVPEVSLSKTEICFWQHKLLVTARSSVDIMVLMYICEHFSACIGTQVVQEFVNLYCGMLVLSDVQHIQHIHVQRVVCVRSVCANLSVFKIHLEAQFCNFGSKNHCGLSQGDHSRRW